MPHSTTIALMYHALAGDTSPTAATVDPHYTVGIDSFTKHVALCIRVSGGVLSARDWIAGARKGTIFTFDDGHDSDYHLSFPTLVEAGASADFFVNPAQVGTPGYATWAQLREMADGGMSIQSHGLDHRYFLTELSTVRLREDLRRSRQEIESHVGHPVTLLAPPGGRNPPQLALIAGECGYTHVLNSKPGRIGPRFGNTLCRLAVTAGLQMAALESWLHGGTALLRTQLFYTALDVSKRLLGDDLYRQIRARLLATIRG